MTANHFRWSVTEKTSTGIVDAGDVAVHVARVDDVGSLLDDLAIMFLNSIPLDQTSDFHEQLFVSERKVKIVVGAGMKSFDACVVGRHQAADQKHGDVGGAWMFLQT